MTRYVMCVLKWLATSNHTKTTRNYLENPLKPSEIIPNLFGSNCNFQKSKVWNISDEVILWRYHLLKLSFCLGQNLLESKLPIKKDVFFWRHKIFSQSAKKKKNLWKIKGENLEYTCKVAHCLNFTKIEYAHRYFVENFEKHTT